MQSLTENQKQILQQNALEIQTKLDQMVPGEKKQALEAAFRIRMRCYNFCIALEYPEIIEEFISIKEAGLNPFDYAFGKAILDTQKERSDHKVQRTLF